MRAKPFLPPFVALSALFLPLAPGATIQSVTADAAQKGNEAVHAVDDREDTKWAAPGTGRWIQLNFSEQIALSELGIGFDHGERDYSFEIRSSTDGKAWSEPLGGARFQSQGREGTQTYRFAKIKSRALRITVFGSNANDWANIHTIQVPGVPPGRPATAVAAQQPTYVVSEWAGDPSIANSVAIDFNDRGEAYVTVVQRRKQSSLDIRNHQDLVKKDLSLTTVEERKAWYREHLTDRNWLPDRNNDGRKDWRDLTVQKDRVLRVRDSDRDGRGDEFQELDAYHSEVTGIAAGVLAVGSDLFVAAEPDFLRYVDRNHDGVPDERQVVASGFQVHMGQGGHNLSGVTLGPDGRVYWSLGDKGHHVKSKEGRLYHMPNSGAIFRCELDGSKVERYSTGQRNAQELAFDAFGNLFSMDNDGDYPGEKERALYITEGSMHGWRLNWQWLRKQDFIKISGLPAYNPWMDEKLFLPDRADQAAYLTPTIGNFGPGPCGFAANPGTALSPALVDCFFMTNQKSEVRVFRFKPKGAFFEFEEGAAIKGGMNNTGLAIGPDGALYAASYGGKKGLITRFDVVEAQQHPLRATVREILAIHSTEPAAEVLLTWMAHPDQRVRMKGQFELVRRDRIADLQTVLANAKSPLLARLHAVWGVGQIIRKDPLETKALLPAWQSEKAEVLAQAAKVIGEVSGPLDAELDGAIRDHLLQGLAHRSERVRFFSAIALGNRGYSESAPALVQLLASDGSRDAYLRHAAVMGLTGTMSAPELAALAEHESRTVRLGAIVALRRMRAPEVRAFLKSETDELVLLEAARAIHDDQSIPEALGDLSALLLREDLTNEALLRRVINAALRHGSGRDLERLEQYLARNNGSAALRRTALASLLWWSEPPVLDPVEGRYRKHAPRSPQGPNQALQRLLPIIAADPDLHEVLLNGIVVRGEAAWLKGLQEQSPALNPRLQVLFLEALATVNSPDLKQFVQAGLASEHEEVRTKARSYAKLAGVSVIEDLLAILSQSKPEGKGQAVLELAKLPDPRAQRKLEELSRDYRAGKAAPEWKLELWQAAKRRGIELPETSDRFEHGGNPERGRKLVMEHAAAQCIRCHQIGTAGSQLGPDLSTIGKSRERSHLVASLLEPNREISPGYGTILLTTTEGEQIAGLLTKQDPQQWTITLADGKERTIAPSTIKEHTLASTMPPMGLILQPEELRDVVSYLAGLK